jgi:hypothetical protein
MTEQKKQMPRISIDMPFDEALRRLIETDPKDLEDLIRKGRKGVEEVETYVEERQRSIRRGARRSRKRFRL